MRIVYLCVEIENILLKMWQTFFSIVSISFFILSLSFFNKLLCSSALFFTFCSSFEMNIYIYVKRERKRAWCEFIRNAHACLHAYFYVFALARQLHDSILFGTYTYTHTPIQIQTLLHQMSSTDLPICVMCYVVYCI